MTASAIPAEAVAAAAAATRAYLRLEGGAEQALLEQVAASAIQLGEAFTGALFLRRAVVEAVAATATWAALGERPVAAIEAVLDAGGAAVALGGYAVDIDADGGGWVRVTGAPGRIAVRYTAGLATTWDALPAPLAQGAVLLAAHLFDACEANAQPPAAVAALWRPFRRLRLIAPERAA